jgi:hypothetical protein
MYFLKIYVFFIHAFYVFLLHTICTDSISHMCRGWHVKCYNVIAITLCYVFALSYNALTLWRNVIDSISYRSEHIGAVIASYSYRSNLIDKRYRFY